jgi:hypothetical protein
MQLQIATLKHQREFINSQSKHTALIGVLVVVKVIAVDKTIIKKMMMLMLTAAYYLPTYGLIQDVAIPNEAA